MVVFALAELVALPVAPALLLWLLPFTSWLLQLLYAVTAGLTGLSSVMVVFALMAWLALLTARVRLQLHLRQLQQPL
jgi:hypothetical protein